MYYYAAIYPGDIRNYNAFIQYKKNPGDMDCWLPRICIISNIFEMREETTTHPNA